MWWLASVALASPLEIRIADPLVISVVLECADGLYRGTVKAGVVTFERLPDKCQIMMIRKSGFIDKSGVWSCTLDTCTQQEVEHRPVTDAPGRINIIMTTPLSTGASLELTCNEGYRVRANVTTNTATFDDVPAEECTLNFKGSVPAKFRPIAPGTWSCNLAGTTAICTRR